MGHVKRDGDIGPNRHAVVPNPEVSEKPQRRTYPAEYKLRILKEADACKQTGEVGALLRREGLYFSHLKTWKTQREEGTINALQPKQRGPKTKPANPLARRLSELHQENRRLKDRLKQAETIIEVQKKVSEILGIEQRRREIGEND